MITLDKDECKALYYLIDELSGCNSHNVFAWDGTDRADVPLKSACAKIYYMANKNIPKQLKDCVEDNNASTT